MESPRLQSVLQESMCYFYQSCSMSVEYVCVVLSICMFANFSESTLEVFCFVYFSFFIKYSYSWKFDDSFVITSTLSGTSTITDKECTSDETLVT